LGKTRVLSGLADFFRGNKLSNKTSLKSEIVFSENNGNEGFANIVTIVFSAFDNFLPINSSSVEDIPRCDYVGLKINDGNSFRTPESLVLDFKNSLKNVSPANEKIGGLKQLKF
jgi:hypothetical protein